MINSSLSNSLSSLFSSQSPSLWYDCCFTFPNSLLKLETLCSTFSDVCFFFRYTETTTKMIIIAITIIKIPNISPKGKKAGKKPNK